MNVDAEGSVAEVVDLLIILLGIDFNCIRVKPLPYYKDKILFLNSFY